MKPYLISLCWLLLPSLLSAAQSSSSVVHHDLRVQISPDEATLWVNGEEVLRAVAGKHPVEVRLPLAAGRHPVLLAYSNIRAPASLSWSVIRSSDGRELPAECYRSWAER